MGKFILKTRKNGTFEFNLLAGNGQAILLSEEYVTKTACLNGIESVRKNSLIDERYERLESKLSKHYFVLKAGNGQIIGRSFMYESIASRENGIESVKKNAQFSEIEDKS